MANENKKDFNAMMNNNKDMPKIQEVSVNNMNNGKGITKARMYIDNECKIIKCIIEPNSSMGYN